MEVVQVVRNHEVVRMQSICTSFKKQQGFFQRMYRRCNKNFNRIRNSGR